MSERIELSGLRDPDPETQGRSALAIYESPRPEEILRDAAAAAAVRTSVAEGNRSAAAILLLGYDPSPRSAELLKDIRQTYAGKRAKLKPWSPAVPLPLVVDVALSRLGDAGARRSLLEGIEEASVEVLAFLLGVLREVDDPAVLHALSKALDDERPVAGGVPSGAEPARRLADVAVNAFIERLGLAVRFTRDPARRYARQDIEDVKRLLKGSLPQ